MGQIDSNTITAMEARYCEVFGNFTEDSIPKGCMLARAEIPALIKLLREQDKQFQMLSACLHALLSEQGGSVTLPLAIFRTISRHMETAGAQRMLTAVKIEDAGAEQVRISI